MLARKWIRWGFVITCAVMALPVHAEDSASASPPPPKWYDWLTIGGELRLRPEFYAKFAPFVPVRIGTSRDAYVLIRARLNFDARPVNHLRVFIQPQFARSFADSESTIANTGLPANQIDLHQGFVEFDKIGNAPVAVKAGRMELMYGDQRLIGNLDWNNFGRNFDGARLRLGTTNTWWVDTFWTWIRRNSMPNQYFSGIYGHWNPGDWLTLEPYTLYLRTNAAGIGGGSYNNVTVGLRAVGKVGNWGYNAEVPVQVGKSGSQNLFANAAIANVHYTFPAKLKPMLAGEFSYASGDSTPGVGTVKTFNQLFPTFHAKHGNMDLVGWQNIYDAKGHVSIRPSDATKVQLEYHAFWLPEPADGLYAASGAQLRAGAAGAGRYVGQEVDVEVFWNWNKYADFKAGYSIFKGGAFLKNTGASSIAHWGYVQATARF